MLVRHLDSTRQLGYLTTLLLKLSLVSTACETTESLDTDSTTGNDSDDDGDTTGTTTAGDNDEDDDIDWSAELDHVFPPRVVELDLNFADDGLTTMVADWNRAHAKTEFSAAFRFDDETLPTVAARLKGYSSLLYIVPEGRPLRTTDKLPLKLDFNRYGGERFHHLDKLALGNNVFDPSYMRERLAARLFAAMDVPVARTAFAQVRLDGHQSGVYTMVQPIDKRFLQAWWGTANDADDGNLYKCVAEERTWGEPGPFICSLNWRGDQISDYVTNSGCSESYDECGFVLKTNEDDDASADYADLIHFIDVLNNTRATEFGDAISTVFDVDTFLRLMAVNSVLVSFDSYFGRVNNYYLYHRPDTGQFVMIPWDLNMAYGLYHCYEAADGDLTRVSIHDPTCKEEAGPAAFPLVDRLLSVPRFRQQYLDYVREVVEQHFTRDNHERWIGEFDDLIRHRLAEDTNYPHRMDEYDEAISDAPTQPGMWTTAYNLLDFVERRRAFVLDALTQR